MYRYMSYTIMSQVQYRLLRSRQPRPQSVQTNYRWLRGYHPLPPIPRLTLMKAKMLARKALLCGKYDNETMKETLYDIYNTHTIADARRLAAVYYQRHEVNEDTDGYDTVDEDDEDYEHEQLFGCQCLKRLLL